MPDPTPKLTAEEKREITKHPFAPNLAAVQEVTTSIVKHERDKIRAKAFEEAAEELDDAAVENTHQGHDEACGEDVRMAEVIRALAKEQGK